MASSDATYFTYATIHGPVTIAAKQGSIVAIALEACALEGARKATDPTNRAAHQLQEYFAGKRREFDLPILLEGTDFQKKAWQAVMGIPYGQTRSSAEVAALAGSPGAHRSIGRAIALNPLAIVVPTHRVTGGSQSGSRARIEAGLRALEQSFGQADAG